MPPDPAGVGSFCNVFHKETTMEKRILAVLLAAFAGSAAAQSHVTSGASGDVVTNGFDNQLAQNTVGTPRSAAAGAERRTSSTANTAGRTSSAGNPPPPSRAYVGSGAGVVATNPYGLCWRSGAAWTPAEAAAPCDAVPRASIPPAPVARAEPQPAPAPEPQPLAAAPAPEPVVIEKITLNTDVLFEFDKAELRPAGQQRLDELAKSAQGANVERIVLTGYADRIGAEQYNKDLSERRAQAVGDYLAQKGVDKDKLDIEGRGEENPVTGGECDKMGRESKKNSKLVACLQPDRRVEAELLGSRETTAGSTGTPSSAGATGTTGTTSSGASSNQ
jgi:OOP family OmpA-OmpF porin